MNTYYIICSNPRSGTNLLRHLLESYQIGIPPEISSDCLDLRRIPARVDKTAYDLKHLHNFLRGCNFIPDCRPGDKPPVNIYAAIVWGFQFHDLIASLRRVSKVPNDVEDIDLLNYLYHDIKYIYLHRECKIKQSVSMVAAQQSGQWCNIRKRSAVKFTDYRYSFGELAQELIWRLDGEEIWKRIFDDFKIEPMTITYERFLYNMTDTIIAIADYLGLKPAGGATPDRTNHHLQHFNAPIKQSHPIKLEWEEILRRDLNRIISEVLNESANNSIIP